MVFYVDMFQDHIHKYINLKTLKNHVKHFAVTIFQVLLTNQNISSK